MMKIKKHLHSQTTLEYILVLIAITLTVLAAVATENSPVRKGIKSLFSGMEDWVSQEVERYAP